MGDYNLYNALAAVGIAQHHGCSNDEIREGLENTIVPGRFELVDRGQDFAVVVDYAHTPDGLENLLTAARRITEGNLICVLAAAEIEIAASAPRWEEYLPPSLIIA